MGIFDKKSCVCKKCGKQFEMLFVASDLCPACKKDEKNEHRRLEELVDGYVEYADRLGLKKYDVETLRSIQQHRAAIVEKYTTQRNDDTRIYPTLGAAVSNKFFVLADYNRVIVDAADVFAIGYRTDRLTSSEFTESILCYVFTNDPYVPAFPIVFSGDLSLLQFNHKSKEGRALVEGLFEVVCPNLTYPVCDVKELKKLIKHNGDVKGNLDKKFMLEQLSQGELTIGVFDTLHMRSELTPKTKIMVDNMGYWEEEE